MWLRGGGRRFEGVARRGLRVSRRSWREGIGMVRGWMGWIRRCWRLLLPLIAFVVDVVARRLQRTVQLVVRWGREGSID